MLRRSRKNTLRGGNQIIDCSTPIVMGIINATPDSFYTESRIAGNLEKSVVVAAKMLDEGASILDIGGMSTRPGAEEISVQEELERVIPVIKAVHQAFPNAILSIDTYRSEVADQACAAGASMINDISGGQFDPDIWHVAARYHAAYVLMHTRGTPSEMILNTDYQDVISDIVKYFSKQLKGLAAAGVTDILLDPGFGFAKTPDQNFKLIHDLAVFRFLDHPVLVGLSRKSTLSRTIGRPAAETLEATTALHMAALINGASVLRVHDVRPAMDTIAMYNQLTRHQE
jgi:dihydropteroate synthase